MIDAITQFSAAIRADMPAKPNSTTFITEFLSRYDEEKTTVML